MADGFDSILQITGYRLHEQWRKLCCEIHCK